jgi:hypothetical protein
MLLDRLIVIAALSRSNEREVASSGVDAVLQLVSNKIKMKTAARMYQTLKHNSLRLQVAAVQALLWHKLVPAISLR